MSILTFTGTEYATGNNGRTCSRLCSYLYWCVSFCSTYLTAAIDETIYCAITNADVSTAYHTFVTLEGIGKTPAASIYITGNSHARSSWGDACIVIFSSWFVFIIIDGSSFYRTDIHERTTNNIDCVCIVRIVLNADVTLVTTPINATCNVSA